MHIYACYGDYVRQQHAIYCLFVVPEVKSKMVSQKFDYLSAKNLLSRPTSYGQAVAFLSMGYAQYCCGPLMVRVHREFPYHTSNWLRFAPERKGKPNTFGFITSRQEIRMSTLAHARIASQTDGSKTCYKRIPRVKDLIFGGIKCRREHFLLKYSTERRTKSASFSL